MTHIPKLGEVKKVHAINNKQLIIRDHNNQIFELSVDKELHVTVARTYDSEVRGLVIESYLDN
jgi:hypothetical protein